MNTLTLNSSELTTLHTETLAALRNAKTLANITRRAETLFADGYRRALLLGTMVGGVFAVTAPEGHSYTVTANSGLLKDECDCPSFAKLGTCKHLQAVQMEVRFAQMADEYDALHTDTDDDKYPEF